MRLYVSVFGSEGAISFRKCRFLLNGRVRSGGPLRYDEGPNERTSVSSFLLLLHLRLLLLLL